MALQRLNLAYFSATGTTAKIALAIGRGLGLGVARTIDLAAQDEELVTIPGDECVVFGVPVFSGRVPAVACRGVERLRGDHTPAIVVCVYGNRAFDDALLELKEMVESRGFCVVSAAAFVAQHSIFPKVAANRPDSSDLAQAEEFGVRSVRLLTAATEAGTLEVPGNRPYRPVKSIPLTPTTARSCNACGLCAKQCPVQAIDAVDPKRIDKGRCISCAHCISVCPLGSKRFGGLLYWLVSRKFTKANAQRKEPCFMYRS